MKFVLPALLLIGFFSFSANSLSAQQVPDDDGVVKITTDLVQIDAVVTDKDGIPVTNLKADEFEVFQDGKPQKITNFSYIATQSQIVGNDTKIQPNAPNAPVLPPTRLTPAAGRILTFIVDDGNCMASTTGMTATRQALEKFVNGQMQPNDLVAIYQTRAGSSMLQQYTTDKSKLMQAIKKIRWYPPAGSCLTDYDGSIFEKSRSNTINEITQDGIRSSSIESEQDRQRREAAEDFANSNQTNGTLGVVKYIVRGLESVPGRKVVFFLSDGISLRSRAGKFLTIFDVMRELTDSANRASVVFNTIDVRGMVNPAMLEARDDVSISGEIDPARPSGTSGVILARERQYNNSQDGLFFLANETGGKFYQGSNTLDPLFRKALSSEKGYYLIAYEPDENTFKGKTFNKIEIKLKRPDLKVSSRAGFIGKPDEEKKQKPKTPESELYQAIAAPLPRSGLNLRLTAFFGSDPQQGNYVRSLVTLNGSEIAFADDGKGAKKAVFDVVAVTLDEKNKVVDEFNKTHTLTVDVNTAKLINANGLVYAADVPVKKEGTYNLRVAMRDVNSKQLGSAGQTISVPDLKKGDLFLSGLSIAEADANGKFASPSMSKPENGFTYLSSKAVPAVRQFKRGTIVAYSYIVYNAKIDKTTNQPSYLAQVNLFQDGKMVSEGTMEKAKISGQTDPTQIVDFGYLRLNEAVPAGDYALQIIIKDPQTNRTVSQWIDFEVVN